MRISFTVKGKVQGVFFRKYTQEKAKALSLTGTVQNLPNGNVSGVAEGEPKAIETFKKWLSETGSPKSRIDEAVFANEEADVENRQFDDFKIIR